MNNQRNVWILIAGMALALSVGIAGKANSQEIAYCKHAQTGEIILIDANWACPAGYTRVLG
jgi:hypothetical protein